MILSRLSLVGATATGSGPESGAVELGAWGGKGSGRTPVLGEDVPESMSVMDDG